MDIAIADVSGKGISAALLVTELHTSYRLLASRDRSLQETALDLNKFLCSTLLIGRFHYSFYCSCLYNEKRS